MIERWLCLGVLASLVLSPLPLSAAESKASRCGFAPQKLAITHMTAGVPLALETAVIDEVTASRLDHRRTRMVERGRACAERYPKTDRYIRSILDRLLEGSNLQNGDVRVPPIEVVLVCSRSIPLPVARATAGRVLQVPRALVSRAESEDAIAAVLGHEIAHLTLRHPEQFIGATTGAKRLSPDEARNLKLMHEREADITGLRLAVNAGYDAHAAIDHLHLVDEMAAQLQREGRGPKRNKPRLHDRVDVRAEQLKSQIDACDYGRLAHRQPVASDVMAELHGFAELTQSH